MATRKTIPPTGGRDELGVVSSEPFVAGGAVNRGPVEDFLERRQGVSRRQAVFFNKFSLFGDVPRQKIWKKRKFSKKFFSPQFSVSEIRFDAEFKQFEPIFCFVIHMANDPLFKLFS